MRRHESNGGSVSCDVAVAIAVVAVVSFDVDAASDVDVTFDVADTVGVLRCKFQPIRIRSSLPLSRARSLGFISLSFSRARA